MSPWNYQTLECLALEQAQVHECPCAPPFGCTILRTTDKIPRPIHTNSGPLIQSVSTIDGEQIFTPTTWLKKKYKSAEKYTSKTLDYYIRNDYIYITTNTTLKTLSITAIFEDPTEILNLTTACDEQITDCTSPLDLKFPVEDSLIAPVLELATNEVVLAFAKMQEDKVNNTNEEKV